MFYPLCFNILSPLSQFEIRDLLSIDVPFLHISMTNVGFFLTLSSLFILVLSLLSVNFNKLISNN